MPDLTGENLTAADPETFTLQSTGTDSRRAPGASAREEVNATLGGGGCGSPRLAQGGGFDANPPAIATVLRDGDSG